MGNPEHIAIIKQGVEAWNSFRQEKPNVTPNLSGADLSEANLEHADLRYGQLGESDLTGAKLRSAKLYSTARDDWVISDIECRYVYWDLPAKQRSPKTETCSRESLNGYTRHCRPSSTSLRTACPLSTH
ncbi:MAG: pentapeptide repeat-containing protein [Phycisphaerales bacterium]|nr:MAG: pentapeptide repeat-containing protein [Phycisphaerales bacterium]